MPLATIGEAPPVASVHLGVSEGVPDITDACRPEMPLSLATKTHTPPSAGLVQTARAVSTSPPCGTFIFCSSPATWPGPPAPLKLSRFSRRIIASLPLCAARCVTLLHLDN